MAVTIKLHGIEAVVEDLRWKCENVLLRRLLETIPLERRRDLYTPWPDYTIAQMAAKALGGKIIEATDPPEYVAGRVY